MDIFERIARDHDTIRRLLERLDDGAEGDQRRSLFEDLQRELWAHGKVEETVFYAAIADFREAQVEALEGLNEHHLINSLLDELNAMTPDNMAWTAKLQVLGELVRHHLDEEEEELFAEARKALTEGQAKELGHAYEERKLHALAALKPLDSPPPSASNP